MLFSVDDHILEVKFEYSVFFITDTLDLTGLLITGVLECIFTGISKNNTFWYLLNDIFVLISKNLIMFKHKYLLYKYVKHN